MAIWQKLFSRVNWENEPSANTPINETNLNKSDYALDQIDDRVIELNNRTNSLEGYETRVSQLEQQALEHAGNAKTSEDNAKTSETNAKTSEDNALISQNLSENWAVGTPTGLREDEATNNSKYWAERASQSAETAGFMGFEIKEDGCLYMGRTPNIVDKVDFAIVNDSDLEVRIYA